MARTLQDHPCLWCGATRYAPSLEHILPEALGCPSGFVLREGICDRCNNGLGHVDQALVRQFEVHTMMAGIPRKKGRLPTVDGWTPLRGTQGAEGPTLHLNAGPGDMQVGDRTLKPAGGSTGIHSVTADLDGPVGTLRFSMDIGRDPKLRRALYKVGLETVAFFLGLPRALAPDLDPVRAYVRAGVGDFGVIVMDAGHGEGHQITPPFEGPDGLVIPVTIFGVSFILDLHPPQSGLDRIEAELRATQGVEGWSRLPLRHP